MVDTTLVFNIVANNRGARQAMQQVGDDATKLGGRLQAFGGIAATALAGVGVAAGGVVVAAASMGIKTAAALEQAEIGFTTLLGSGQKAQSFLKDLTSFAAATPFELPGLVDASRTLLGVGLDAKQVIPLLRDFGDAAGAVGVGQEEFQRIMLATSQAISAGRFATEDLNQITENGIPIWKILADATGKPVPVLRELASEGKLLAKDILPLLQRQMHKDYGGSMERQSKTLTGVWSTFMDTINIGLATAIKPLVPWLTATIPQAAEVLGGAISATGKTLEVFFSAITGHSEINEFEGGLKTLNNLALTVYYALSDATDAARDFFDEMRAGKGIPGALGDGLETIADAGAGVVKFFTENEAALKTLIGTLTVVIALTKAHGVAMSIQAAGGTAAWIVSYVTGLGLVQTALKISTAAQWAFNAAVASSGIGLLIIGIGVLVTTLVTLWYTNDGFRRVMIKTWRAVQDAVGTAVDWITGTAWPALQTAWDAVASGAMWLWQQMVTAWNAISGVVQAGVDGVVLVVRGIGSAFATVGHFFADVGRSIATALAPVGTAIMFLWRNVAIPAFQGMGVLLQIWDRAFQIVFKSVQIWVIILGRVFTGLWHDLIEPALTGIGDLATWLWTSVLVPAASGIKTALDATGKAFLWLWHAIVDPAMKGISIAIDAAGDALTWLWRSVAVPALNAIGTAAQVMWRVAIQPVLTAFKAGWDALGRGIDAVWRKVLAPALDALRTFVRDKLGPAFEAGVRAIRAAWDGVKDAAKDPIRFVVETVINRGIIGTFNDVADYFGVSPVAPVKLPKGFAAGGVFNEPTAIVGEGGPDPEYVIPTDRKYRKRALGLYEALGAKLMASGGVLDWVSNPVGQLKSAVSPWLNQLSGIESSPFGRMIGAGPRMLAGRLGGYLRDLAGEVMSTAVSGLRVGNESARSLGKLVAAQGFGWTGAEWTALDKLIMGESGWNPAAQNPTSTAYGIFQFLDSTWATVGASKTSNAAAQISAGLKYIKQRYGSPSAAYEAWLSRSPHWYDQGGWLMPGLTMAYNGTGRPEQILPPGRTAPAGGEAQHVHFHFHQPVGSQRQMEDWVVATMERLKDQRRLPTMPSRLTGRARAA